jgi:hypothetical protein
MVIPPACSEDKGYTDEVMYYGTKAMVPSCQSHSKAMVKSWIVHVKAMFELYLSRI